MDRNVDDPRKRVRDAENDGYEHIDEDISTKRPRRSHHSPSPIQSRSNSISRDPDTNQYHDNTRSLQRGDRHSQSHRRDGNEHRHRRRRHSSEKREGDVGEVVLPYGVRGLVKADLKAFTPLLGLYLDVQKGRDLEVMGEEEVRGRWKSFMGKWNRGELSNGYYDPETLKKAVDATADDGRDISNGSRDGRVRSHLDRDGGGGKNRQSDSEDEIGPALPPSQRNREGRRGPTIPRMEDLEMRRETSLSDKQAYIEDLRYARKTDRKLQKEALEELLPRPDVGRERQLEKKKLVNEKMKGFREGPDTGVAEMLDEELMGDDGVDSLRKLKKMEERKKTEKEVRREERERARREEREERLKGYRSKEEETLEMLKALKRQNFG